MTVEIPQWTIYLTMFLAGMGAMLVLCVVIALILGQRNQAGSQEYLVASGEWTPEGLARLRAALNVLQDDLDRGKDPLDSLDDLWANLDGEGERGEAR